jgi:hypothetical protein
MPENFYLGLKVKKVKTKKNKNQSPKMSVPDVIMNL